MPKDIEVSVRADKIEPFAVTSVGHANSGDIPGDRRVKLLTGDSPRAQVQAGMETARPIIAETRRKVDLTPQRPGV